MAIEYQLREQNDPSLSKLQDLSFSLLRGDLRVHSYDVKLGLQEALFSYETMSTLIDESTQTSFHFIRTLRGFEEKAVIFWRSDREEDLHNGVITIISPIRSKEVNVFGSRMHDDIPQDVFLRLGHIVEPIRAQESQGRSIMPREDVFEILTRLSRAQIDKDLSQENAQRKTFLLLMKDKKAPALTKWNAYTHFLKNELLSQEELAVIDPDVRKEMESLSTTINVNLRRLGQAVKRVARHAGDQVVHFGISVWNKSRHEVDRQEYEERKKLEAASGH